ncbi:MAG: hypothetical protein ACTTJ6_00820 [Treponema sp.]
MGNTENSIAIYDKVDELLKKLYLCTKVEQIEDVFDNYNIHNFKERSDLLNRCMGFKETFGTPEETTDEEDYEFDRAVFV